ncbi:MAG: flagellar motor switch protein FliN [Lachnospiraceae bacterium]|jgi:flagellar motor switch protein FliN/FliY|nr:flagellar motor switch protein FliN [Lachnospiraceae bacterium]
MGAISFNEMEIDAIGEIMNISLGASATAVSTLLGATVNITTPVVKVASSSEFEFHKLEPAVGVEIAYVEGIEGSNIMMFSRNDVRIIVGMLMGMEIPEEDFELDEINRSAICEVMNQMMGSSATALSEFLGMTVNISTPISFEVEDEQTFKDKYFPTVENRVVVRFALEVEGKLNSEFLNIMPEGLAKRLLEPFKDSFSQAEPAASPTPAAPVQEEPVKEEPAAASASGGVMSQEEIEKLLQQSSEPVKEEPAAAPASGGVMSQEEIEKLLQQSSAPAQEAPVPQAAAPQPQVAPQAAAPQPSAMPQMAPPPYGQPVYQPAGDPMMLQLLNQMQQSQMQMMEFMKELKGKEREPQKPRESAVIHSVNSSSFDAGFEDGMEAQENQEMLMKVPLEISVEIGRTKKKVKDILEFTQGSLVVLDKMAGEQADLYVNGQCIAKGDIVVVEDNFGIRVTEIISRNINPESL